MCGGDTKNRRICSVKIALYMCKELICMKRKDRAEGGESNAGRGEKEVVTAMDDFSLLWIVSFGAPSSCV